MATTTSCWRHCPGGRKRSLQLESLLKEIAALRESHTQQLTALRESLAMSIEFMHMTISELNCRLDEKERTVLELTEQFLNVQAEGRH